MSAKEAYQQLFDISRKAHVLNGIECLLHWDQETYMPSGGASIRAEQMKVMASLVHSAKTSKEMRTAIDALIDIETGTVKSSQLTPAQEAAVKRWRRDFRIEAALPGWFVEEFAQLISHSQEVWKTARAQNNFDLFAPYLETVIEMCQRKADFLGYKEVPYDALIDLYEPGATTANTTKLFQAIRQPLVELLKKVSQKPKISDEFLRVTVAEPLQNQFAKKILDAMGYSFQRGNLSKSTHPFCQYMGPNDCRITTRINPNDFMSNLLVVMHEGGHALYQLQLPEEHYGSPLGDSISMAVHESQSRWWECSIGLSKPFWNHFFPLLQKDFAPVLDTIPQDNFWRAINKVEPSFIRVEADELTYPLHVILRFEMEQDLISGKLAVKDIPDAWNAKMKELLGIVPPTNTLGCLQDTHWSWGTFGYFPTYLMGNAYAAFLLETFKHENPQWDEQMSQGQFSFINDWLKKQVHQHGRQYNSDELLQNIGKKPFTAQPYIDYLQTKYSEVYQL